MVRLSKDSIKKLYFDTTSKTNCGEETLTELYSKYLNRPQIITNQVTDETFTEMYSSAIQMNTKLQNLKDDFIKMYGELRTDVELDDNTIMNGDMEEHLDNLMLSFGQMASISKTASNKLFENILSTVSLLSVDCSQIPTLEKFNMDIEQIDKTTSTDGKRNQKTIQSFANNLTPMYPDTLKLKPKGNIHIGKVGSFGLKNIQKYSNVTLPEFDKALLTKVLTTKTELYSFNIDCTDVSVMPNSFVNINSGCCLIVPFDTVAICYIENTDENEYTLITPVDSADVGQLHLSLYTKNDKLHNYKVFIYLFAVNTKQLSINNPNGKSSNKKYNIKESNISNILGSFDNLKSFKKKPINKFDKSTSLNQPIGTFLTKRNTQVTISKAPFLIMNRKRSAFNNSMIFSGGLTNKLNIEPHIINYNSNETKNYSIIAPTYNIRTKINIDDTIPIPQRIVMGLNGFYSNYPFYKKTVSIIRKLNELDTKYNRSFDLYKNVAKNEGWLSDDKVYQYGLNIVQQLGCSMPLITPWDKYNTFVEIINNYKTTSTEKTIDEIKGKLEILYDYQTQRSRILSYFSNNEECIKLVTEYEDDMLGALSKVDYKVDNVRFTNAVAANNNKRKNTDDENEHELKIKIVKK